ncbi:MAG: threonine/serine dehydratase [Acidimicrobiia bacterium]
MSQATTGLTFAAYARQVLEEITRADIEAAANRIGPFVRRTPTLDLGHAMGEQYRLTLKLDSMQPTGSFKVRGAFSDLTKRAVPESGVVAASGGNFGLAVAYAAGTLGHAATVFVPGSSPEEKVGRIATLGADVRVVPGYYPDALAASRAWGRESGAHEIHAYDQPDVVAGQGTCAMEIIEQVPGPASILVAVGGGGLIGGIASWVRDGATVVGVESEGCPALHAAREAGGPVDVAVGGIAASALGASRLGDHAWRANEWIDQSVLVPDQDIVNAQTWLWETCRVMAEPAACAPIAALASGAYLPVPGENVVAVISGANTGGLEPLG